MTLLKAVRDHSLTANIAVAIPLKGHMNNDTTLGNTMLMIRFNKNNTEHTVSRMSLTLCFILV